MKVAKLFFVILYCLRSLCLQASSTPGVFAPLEVKDTAEFVKTCQEQTKVIQANPDLIQEFAEVNAKALLAGLKSESRKAQEVASNAIGACCSLNPTALKIFLDLDCIELLMACLLNYEEIISESNTSGDPIPDEVLVATSIMWAFSAIVVHNVDLQEKLAFSPGFLRACFLMLSTKHAPGIASASLVLCKVASGCENAQNIIASHDSGICKKLVELISNETVHPNSRGLAAYAVQSIAVNNSENKKLFFVALEATPALVSLVDLVDPNAQSIACLALRTLAVEVPEHKFYLAHRGTLNKIAELLKSPTPQVIAQAAAAIHDISDGCKEAQKVLSTDDTIPTLIGLLTQPALAVEHIIATLVVLAKEHEANTSRIGHIDILSQIVSIVASDSIPRNQGFACALLRTLIQNRHDIREDIISLNALNAIMGICKYSESNFAKEQAIALLHRLVKDSDQGRKILFTDIGDNETILNLVTSCSSTPQMVTSTCTLLCIHSEHIIATEELEDNSEKASKIRDHLGIDKAFIAELCWLSSVPEHQARMHAIKLMSYVFPEALTSKKAYFEGLIPKLPLWSSLTPVECKLCHIVEAGEASYMTLPCFHIFHEKCAKKHFVEGEDIDTTCPTCNKEVMKTLAKLGSDKIDPDTDYEL